LSKKYLQNKIAFTALNKYNTYHYNILTIKTKKVSLIIIHSFIYSNVTESVTAHNCD